MPRLSRDVFYFVVRHLRFLARIPFLPHLFEAILITHTFIFHRSTLTAMEELEELATTQLALTLAPHKMGGLGFIRHEDQREIGHLHGNGLLDIKTDSLQAASLRQNARIRPHHVFPNSGWITFPIRNSEDIPFALQLLQIANSHQQPSPA